MISRQKLLEAAAKVFAESGFRGATTRRIAEAAGVNEVTLFRQFGSKSQLMCAAIESLHPEAGLRLPDDPGDVERELVRWAEAHLESMRRLRHVIRKTMAELDEHPEMSAIVCEAKTPYFNALVAYATKVRRPTTAAARDEVQTACAMLMSSLFADAIGRDLVPTTYPSPAGTAARKYVKTFLKVLGESPGHGDGRHASSNGRRRGRVGGRPRSARPIP
jgi:AcrR family transcriptional regulator